MLLFERPSAFSASSARLSLRETSSLRDFESASSLSPDRPKSPLASAGGYLSILKKTKRRRAPSTIANSFSTHVASPVLPAASTAPNSPASSNSPSPPHSYSTPLPEFGDCHPPAFSVPEVLPSATSAAVSSRSPVSVRVLRTFPSSPTSFIAFQSVIFAFITRFFQSWSIWAR